jgi:hypothetical protein
MIGDEILACAKNIHLEKWNPTIAAGEWLLMRQTRSLRPPADRHPDGLPVTRRSPVPGYAPLEPHSRKFLFVNSKVGFLISGEKSKDRST